MNKNTPKLNLHEPAIYQIKVPGAIGTMWVDDASSMRITVEESSAGQLITTLTRLMDQAALQGLLRRLYGLGLPLISVVCVEFMEKNLNNVG